MRTLVNMLAIALSPVASYGGGFIQHEFREGYQLVCAGFDDYSGIAVSFPDPPEGAFYIRHDGHNWVTNKFQQGEWDYPEMNRPGSEGMIFYTPVDCTNTTGGGVLRGTLLAYIPKQGAMLGSPAIQQGLLTSQLAFPEVVGTRVKTIDRTTGAFVDLAEYTDLGWFPSEPLLNVGDALWVEPPTDLVWDVFFDPMPHSGPIYYAIVNQPSNTVAVVGEAVTMSVTTIGESSSYRFHWQRNGRDIEGATNTVLRIESVSPADAGAYWIRAIRQGGTSSTSEIALLSIASQPFFEMKPSSAGLLSLLPRNLGQGDAWAEESTNLVHWSRLHDYTLIEDQEFVPSTTSPRKFYRIVLDEVPTSGLSVPTGFTNGTTSAPKADLRSERTD